MLAVKVCNRGEESRVSEELRVQSEPKKDTTDQDSTVEISLTGRRETQEQTPEDMKGNNSERGGKPGAIRNAPVNVPINHLRFLEDVYKRTDGVNVGGA